MEIFKEMDEDLEFARRTHKALKEVEEGKFTRYPVEEYFRNKEASVPSEDDINF